MKKAKLAIGALLGISAMLATGCSKGSDANATPEVATDDSTVLVVRYIDTDSVNAHYKLAQDILADVQTSYTNLQALINQKGGEIQRMQQTMQQKYDSHAYSSEAQMQADANQLQRANQQAEDLVKQRQQAFLDFQESQNARINDSIEVFIKDLCKKNGIDVVLPKAVGLYFNEKLDITNTVIEGLNARYDKFNNKATAKKDEAPANDKKEVAKK
jgi:outer membrane protein